MLKRVLQKSDPFKVQECASVKDRECFVCSTGGRVGQCRKDGVTYNINCDKCSGVYVGESGFNAFTRGQGHLQDYKYNRTESVMHRHEREAHMHDSTRPKYNMRVTSIHGDDCLTRQVTEAVNINKTENAINNRSEWGQSRLPRVSFTME